MKPVTDHKQDLSNPRTPGPYSTVALLPPNATQAERDILEASDFSAVLQQYIESLQQLRTQPSTQVLKHRLWESGLEEIHHWIKDPKQALEHGQYWRSLLGTPKSVYMALDWLGIKQAQLHEGERGEHFYDVRLELNTNSDRYLAATKLTQYCLPVRCRLQRVYNGQARGPLILGNAQQGLMSKTLLQAEPGITIEGFGDIRFSFIQTHDPRYQLQLKTGHSEHKYHALGHYGNAFHRFGEDLLGSRRGLHQYQTTCVNQSVRHSLNVSEAQPERRQSDWSLRWQAQLDNPKTTQVVTTTGHQADVHALASTQQQQHLHYQRTQRPLHFSHFEELLCQAH